MLGSYEKKKKTEKSTDARWYTEITDEQKSAKRPERNYLLTQSRPLGLIKLGRKTTFVLSRVSKRTTFEIMQIFRYVNKKCMFNEFLKHVLKQCLFRT